MMMTNSVGMSGPDRASIGVAINAQFDVPVFTGGFERI